MTAERPLPKPEPGPDGCPSARDLEAVLHDTAPAEQAHALAEHLESCAACRERLDQLAGAARVLPSAASAPTQPVPPSLAAWMRQQSAASACPEGRPEFQNFAGNTILDPPHTADAIGRFAGYEIVERIAEGGMGVVFKARDPALERIVALKILSPTLATRSQARDRFLREARAAAAVSHEHVVAIHAVGQERGLPYLVMQFVQGTTLEARLRQKPLDLLSTLRIAHQTALGLGAAHDQGLIHRDIKPGNLLLENGVERVKITDFGLARAVDQPDLTGAGKIAGTPEFMSPEQASGQPIDARSDLFSLGSVLYTMATGHSPFLSDSIPATLRRVADFHPPPVETLNPEIPESVSDLIQRLLSKDPEFRPASAHAVAEALAALLATHATDSRLALLAAPARHSTILPAQAASRSKGIVLIVAGIILAALLVPKLSGTRSALSANGKSTTNLTGDAAMASARHSFRIFDPTNQAWMPPQPSLPLAVAAAPSGGVIEIALSGLIECDPIAITGKPLTLRAARGHAPILVNRSTTLPLLRTDAALVLQSLEVRAAFGDSDRSPPWPERLTTRRLVSARLRERGNLLSLIQSRNAPLVLSACRLVASSRKDATSDLISVFGSSQVTLLGTELYNTAGAGILWRRHEAKDVPTVEIHQSLIYCNQPILLAGAGSEKCRIRIEQSTVFGEHVVALPLPMETSLSLRDSIVCSRGFLNPITENKASMRWSLTESNNLLIAISAEAPFPTQGTSLGPGSTTLRYPFRERLAARTRLSQRLTTADFTLPDDVLRSLQPTPDTATIPRGMPDAPQRSTTDESHTRPHSTAASTP